MAPSGSRLTVWFVIVLYGAMTAIVLFPVFSVQVPAMGDYLNHLARMHILSDIDQSEALSKSYRVHWQLIPYLAMDAAFVVLNHVATIYEAGRIFVAICVVLPVVSAAALHVAVYRRFSPLPAVAFLFCYNALLSWGFLNYLPALCLAVLLFAGWIASTEWSRWRRAALFSMLALALYLSHLVAFAAYCLVLGGFELGRAWRAGFSAWRATAADWLAAAFQAAPAVAVALSVHVDRNFVGPAATIYGDFGAKLFAVLSPVWFLNDPIVDLSAAVFALVMLTGGLLSGRLRLSPVVLPSIIVVVAVAVCLPRTWLGTFGMDFRLPVLLVLLIIGATTTTDRTNLALGGVVLFTFLALATLRAGHVGAALRTADAEIGEVRGVVSAMPHGMRLLVVNTSPPQPSVVPSWATWHIALVAVIDRDAFVPTLFTGLSTVHPAPALRTSSTPNGRPITLSDLMDGLTRTDDPATIDGGDGGGGRVYWLGWPDKFDYVLVEHFGSHLAKLPAILRLESASSVADLYRIDKTGSP